MTAVILPIEQRARRTTASALWAAWADALGFITELTDESGVRRRLGGQPLREPVPWKRRVGGQFGVIITLPAGCYSDDTQLRLATSRAMQGRGFDVEAFARVELPVWPNYALGGGRASKSAAVSMAKGTLPWFGNVYDGWLEAGGNGVAMRIQPHVWSARHPSGIGPHLLDVIANGVVSHGHPRALVGAVLHAVLLGSVLESGAVPPPAAWGDLLKVTAQAVELVDDHPQLAPLWRPVWESMTRTPLVDAWLQTVDECRQQLNVVAELVDDLKAANEVAEAPQAARAYEALVQRLELTSNDRRGSATATVVAATALAAGVDHNPAAAALLAAQAIGTDTDTIATMAAAVIGAADGVPHRPAPVLDSGYIASEAARCARIASGEPGNSSFEYPDLLSWTPPRSQLDAVGLDDKGRPALAGLGWLRPVDPSDTAERRGTTWQWMTSDFGPTFLIKRRDTPRNLPVGCSPRRRQAKAEPVPPYDKSLEESAVHQREVSNGHHPSGRRSDDFRTTTARDAEASSEGRENAPSVDSMLEWVRKRKFSDEQIGYAVRRVAELGNIEQFVAFTVALRAEIRQRDKH